MSNMNAPGSARPLPPGRYAVQLVAPKDAPPSGRFAVERINSRGPDDPVEAEFAICCHILVKRDLRDRDRVHVMQRYRGKLRNMIKRVQLKGNSMLLFPVKTGRGRKGNPIEVSDVVMVGLVTGCYTEYRL
jgi:hypothetical protein